MTTPILKAEMESGIIWDDPSEDMLYELLGDVERGDEQFIVVERSSDPSGQTYMQAIVSDDGSWLLERRDGGPDAHYRALLGDRWTVHAAMSAWAFERPGWAEAAAWEQTTVCPEDQIPRPNGPSSDWQISVAYPITTTRHPHPVSPTTPAQSRT